MVRRVKHGLLESKGSRSSVTCPGVSLGTGRRSSQAPPPKSAAAATATSKSPSDDAMAAQATGMRSILPLFSVNVTSQFLDWSQRQWGGSCLQGSEGGQGTTRVSFLALLSYSTFAERVWMLVGLIFAFFAGLCLPTWLILLARAIDTFAAIATLILQGAGEEAFDMLQQELYKLCIAFLLLGAVSLLVGFCYVAIWTYTGERQALRIKEQFVHAALRQDAEWFDINHREELPTAIANSMIHIQAALGRPMADLFSNTVSAFASLFVAIALDAPLAIVMLCIVPIVAIIVMMISCFSRKANRQGSLSFVAAGSLATEVISGIKTVASLCAEQWALSSYTQNIIDAQKHSIHAGFLAGLASGITGLLFYCTYTVAFMLGTYQVAEAMQVTVIAECFWEELQQNIQGTQNNDECRVSGAAVMCCIYGVILSATFFGLMAPGLNNINLARQAAATIFDTIHRIPVIDAENPLGEVPPTIQGKIAFRNIIFAYPTTPKPIFQNFHLTIAAGSTVAFVGPSGSGKSTIAKLLLRFYAPLGGDIVLDDKHSLGGLRLSWWRQQVGYVAQSPILFPGTIRYNIACGKDGATEEEIVEAAKAASAHEFILELPQGYDTYFSGTSVQMSTCPIFSFSARWLVLRRFHHRVLTRSLLLRALTYR
jgi:ATP-binding cassette, subfamily B (MDR/TAP), member 1